MGLEQQVFIIGRTVFKCIYFSFVHVCIFTNKRKVQTKIKLLSSSVIQLLHVITNLYG